jgi:hypothetical protein
MDYDRQVELICPLRRYRVSLGFPPQALAKRLIDIALTTVRAHPSRGRVRGLA